MMELRSNSTVTVMNPENVMKNLSSLHRRLGLCLRPNRGLAQTASYGEVISGAIIETDSFVVSSLQWDNIFGIPFPTNEGEM